MKRNFVRIGILGALILLCIWQTTILWLGNVSSHNFFASKQEDDYQQYIVYPKEIWADDKGHVYKIDAVNSEKYKLITELMNELKRDNIQLNIDEKTSYDSLLAGRGIVYEYGIPLSITELIGKNFQIRKKEITAKIKEIFVELGETSNYKTNVYFVDEEGNVKYSTSFGSHLFMHNEMIGYVTDEEHDKPLEYQSCYQSTDDIGLFKGNVFYPQNNKLKQITYQQIQFCKLITAGDKETLENMVSDLFANPIYKKVNITTDGITFYDNLNLTVKYNNVGTLEFKKSASDDAEKLTASQKIEKIYSFIEETHAIPHEIKEGLYLQQITDNKENDETTYYFGYEYENNDVIFTDQVKNQLGIDACMELTIRKNDIIHGKWIMREPQVINNVINDLPVEAYEAISTFKGNPDIAAGSQMDNLECAYIFNSLESILDYNWVAFVDDKPLILESPELENLEESQIK